VYLATEFACGGKRALDMATHHISEETPVKFVC